MVLLLPALGAFWIEHQGDGLHEALPPLCLGLELLPTPGQWASDFLAAKLVYRFLGRIFSSPYYQPST